MTSTLFNGQLKIRDLFLVDTLTKEGSVVGAAAALHVTQPVITRSLRKIEESLGVQLYERGSRGITPTVHGEAFTNHARAVLAQLRQAKKHLDEISDASRGTVHVGTHLAGSHFLLPRAIAQLKAEHPRLAVIVREASPDQLLIELRSGRLDMIIGRLAGAVDEDVIQHVMVHDMVRIAVGTHHPLATHKVVRAADLTDRQWILPGAGTQLRHELERWFARHNMSLPTSVVEATSFLTVRQLLIETNMLAALPGLLVSEDPNLMPLPIKLGRVGREIGLTLMKHRRLSPTGGAMAAAVRSAAEGLIHDHPDIARALPSTGKE